MTAFTRSLLIAAICLHALPSYAQHAGHDAAASTSRSKDAPSTKAFRRANDSMHKQMNIAYTGDADVDFIRGMIPHHQGAIEMARVQLAHGKDPAVRKLAEKIIADQEREIGEMKDWIAKHAK